MEHEGGMPKGSFMKQGDEILIKNDSEEKSLEILIKEAFVRYEFLSDLRFKTAQELAHLLNKEGKIQKEHSRLAVADPELKGLVYVPFY